MEPQAGRLLLYQLSVDDSRVVIKVTIDYEKCQTCGLDIGPRMRVKHEVFDKNDVAFDTTQINSPKCTMFETSLIITYQLT